MKNDSKMGKGKQSSVIMPGTGSGSRPGKGKTMTPTSAPAAGEKQTLGRKGAVKSLPK